MTQTLKKVVILSLEERGIQESTKLLEANGFEVEIRQPRKREWLTYSHSGMGGEREREQAVVERACLFLLSHLKIYWKQKEPEKAEKILLESLSELEASRDLQWLKVNAELLAEIYEEKGDLKKTIYFKDRIISLTDSLTGTEQMDEIRKLEVERFLKQNQKETTSFDKNPPNHSRRKLGFAAIILALLSGVWWYFKKQKSTQIEAGENTDSQLKQELEKKKLENKLAEINKTIRKLKRQMKVLEKEKIELELKLK